MERAKYLAQTQEALLNILEDMQESREELEKTNIELKRAKEEIEEFSRGLEVKVKERTFELSVLYEVSNAISYTLDYQQLLKLIMDSLFKIVDYDLCASLLFDAQTANITLKPVYPESARFVDDVKDRLIDSTSMLTGENIHQKHISDFLIPSAPGAKPEKIRKFDQIRSFFNVPFVVQGNTIGMINVSSCKEKAFSEDNIKLMYTIANQASDAMERLQAVITAEKSKMESMVESMIEGVIMVDVRGKIVVFNPQARRMLGFGLDEVVSPYRLGEKIKTIGLDKAQTVCWNEAKLVTKEILVPPKDLFLRCDITPVKDARDEIIGIVTMLTDITKAKEVDKMKSEFVSTVSHELRTPLVGIGGVINNILLGVAGQISDKVKTYLQMANEDIKRLDRLISDLLDYSRIERGKIKLNNEKIDICTLAEGAVRTLTPKIEEKSVNVSVDYPPSPIYCCADGDKITQVFINLIYNAIKFTPKGGDIRITMALGDEKKMAEVTVADTGIGIAQENIPKLFHRFVQINRKDGAGTKGTGLGLAICKGIVEAHKGNILVESESHKGSKFIFTLPCVESSLTTESTEATEKCILMN